MLQYPDASAAQGIAVTDLGPIMRTGSSAQSAGGHAGTPQSWDSSNADLPKDALEANDIEEEADEKDARDTGNDDSRHGISRDDQLSIRHERTKLRRSSNHESVVDGLTRTTESNRAQRRQTQRIPGEGSYSSNSEPLNYSRVGVATRQSQLNATNRRVSVEDEEEKLRVATIKLVTWLRNRLRKRLNDVAMLEAEKQAEDFLLQKLNVSIVNTTSERENEIQMKIENQKKLSAFRQTLYEPEKHLHTVQAQTKKLSDQLAHLGKMYNSLAERRRSLRERLHKAGFSHWLEANGKEYLPDTAVGVLSKSAEVLQPFAQGIEQAVILDRKLATRIEGVIPTLSKRSIFGIVVEEFLMLLPIIPMLFVLCKLFQTMHKLSVVHLVMYEAIGFMFESCLLLLVSVILGRETIGALQDSKNSKALLAGLFINAVMYGGYIFTQVLMSVLQWSRFEILQTVLTLAVGYHYYLSVFRPVMLNEKVSVTAIAHMMSIVNFCVVAYEKKRILKLRTPYEEQVTSFLRSIEGWIWETIEAMGNVFYEGRAEMDMYSERSDTSLSDLSSNEAYSISIEKTQTATIQEPTVSGTSATMRGYGRWTGGRIVTGLRQHNASSFSSDQQQIPSTVQSGSRQRTPFMRSESSSSTAYGSCLE